MILSEKGSLILDGLKALCIIMITVCSVQIVKLCYVEIDTAVARHQAEIVYEAKKETILKIVPVKYREYLQYLCRKYGIPLHVAVPLIQVESEWNQDSVGWNSDSVDIGLCQINSKNHAAFEKQFPGYSVYNPRHNLEIGLWFLSKLYAVHGNWFDAVCSYNAGSGAVFNNKLPESTKKYVVKIFDRDFN